MPLNVGEANAANQLIAWILDGRREFGDVVTDDDARDAAALLADSANKRLMAGTNGDRVRALWIDRRLR